MSYSKRKRLFVSSITTRVDAKHAKQPIDAQLLRVLTVIMSYMSALHLVQQVSIVSDKSPVGTLVHHDTCVGTLVHNLYACILLLRELCDTQRDWRDTLARTL